jgi:hypothetical protein
MDIYTPPDSDNVIYITCSGAFIKFEYFDGDTESIIKKIKKITNYFTLWSKNLMGDDKCLKCYKLDKAKGRIIVPRFGIYEILNKKYGLQNFTCKSQIKKGNKPNTPFTWIARQTDNQKMVTDIILSQYYTPERSAVGSAGVIVDLDAGQGKSYVAAYIIAKLQKKTAIILHTTALVEQWVKVLQTSLGDVSIGYYYSKRKIDGDIIIMIVNSASKPTFTFGNIEMEANDFYKQFGFIIYDECHLYCNSMALKTLKNAQSTYMMGLSATTNENSLGYDRSVWWNIGPVLDTRAIPGFVSTSEDFTAIVHRVMYIGPDKYTKSIVNEHTGMTCSARTINMICEDKRRSKLIIKCVKEGLALGLNMFVFADRREYLLQLRDMLQDGEILTTEDEFVRIVGGAASDALETAELKSKVIFTTYQYMGTGKSVVKMTGLVLANPRKSKMKQYINRIFRLGSDITIQRHIWDICDMKLSLASQWYVRKKHYDSKGYEIVPKRVHYTEIEDEIIEVGEIDEYAGQNVADLISRFN